MNSGSTASALATPILCRCPPLNSCGNLVACSGLKPTVCRSSCTISSRSCLLCARPWISMGSPTISPTVMRGLRDAYGSWKIICILRLKGSISDGGREYIGTPSNVTLPAVGSYRRQIVLPAVVLPQPDSPTRPSVSPRSIVKLMSSTALRRARVRLNNPPSIAKYFFRFLTSIRGAITLHLLSRPLHSPAPSGAAASKPPRGGRTSGCTQAAPPCIWPEHNRTWARTGNPVAG
jgi:hypothetical protein